MKAPATAARLSLKNILLATDFSTQSNAALPHALALARKYGAKLFAVHVISLSPFPNSSPTLAWAVAHRVVTLAHCPVLTVRE